jgi:hypothetical protein
MTVHVVEPIRLGIEVDVSLQRAWDAFVGELGTWWPTATHSVSADADRIPDEIVVEPREGGEIYEQIGAVRHHWATITVWEPPGRLVFSWRVNPENPATEVEVTFADLTPGRMAFLESALPGLANILHGSPS